MYRFIFKTNMAELTERAAGGTEQRRKSLVGSEDLLCTVRVEDCVFESGDLQRALDGSPTDQLHELEGDVMVENTAKYALSRSMEIGYSRRRVEGRMEMCKEQ